MAKGLLAGVVFGVLVAVLILAVAALQLESRKPMIVMVAPEVLSILGAQPPVRDHQGAVPEHLGWRSSSAGDATKIEAAGLSNQPEASIVPMFDALPKASVLRPEGNAPEVATAPEIAIAPELPSESPMARVLNMAPFGLGSDGLAMQVGERVPVLLGDPAGPQARPEVSSIPSQNRMPAPVETGRGALALAIIQTPKAPLVGLARRPQTSERMTSRASRPLAAVDIRPIRPNVPELPLQLDIAAPVIESTGTPVLTLDDPTERSPSLGAGIAVPEIIGRRVSASLAAPLVTPKPADIAAPPTMTGLISGGQLAGEKTAPQAPTEVAVGRPVMSIVLDRQSGAPVELPVWTQSIIVPAVALAGDAATVPAGAEILPRIQDSADRGALSALAWDIARHSGRIGPLYSTTRLANDQAEADLLGLLRAADIGLVLGAGGLPLLEPANGAGLLVAPSYSARETKPEQPLWELLDRAAIHGQRDGGVILIVRDTEANRAEIEAWLDTAPEIVLVSVAQALKRLRATR